MQKPLDKRFLKVYICALKILFNEIITIQIFSSTRINCFTPFA
jgi:hypothetical protein